MGDKVNYEKLLASLLPFISPDDIAEILKGTDGEAIHGIVASTYDGDDDAARLLAHKTEYTSRHEKNKKDEDADSTFSYEDGVKDGKDLKDVDPDDEFIKSVYESLEERPEDNDYCRGIIDGYEAARSEGAKKPNTNDAQSAIDDTLNAFKTLSDERCKEILTSYDSFGDDEEKIKEFVDSLSDEEYAALYKELAKRELTPEDVVATLSPEALDVLKEALNDDEVEEVAVESEPEEETSDNKNALARLLGSIKL